MGSARGISSWSELESVTFDRATLERDLEVNGRTILSILGAFQFFKHIPARIMSKHKLGTLGEEDRLLLDPEAWYPMVGFLDSMEEISKQLGDATLYTVGQQIPKNAAFPDWVVDIESALNAINVAYHMNHRKRGQVMFDEASGELIEGIGSYRMEPGRNGRGLKAVCNNPYPCHFDRGIISAMATNFHPTAIVRHASGQCRSKGDDCCIYEIRF